MAAIAWLVPSVAKAQPSDADRTTARALAREGYEAQKHGRFELAADRFQRADALVHAPTLLLGLARAQVGLGKLVEAHEIYERILREPLAPGAPTPFAKAVEDARRESPLLAARLAWVTLDVHGPAAPEVYVDDVLVPAAALGVKWAFDPGRHNVKAAAPGFAPLERILAAEEGTTQTLSLSMVPVAEPAPEAPPRGESAATSTLSPPPEPSKSSSFRTSFAIGALGVGVTGLAVGGVTGVLALTKHASLSTDCPNGHCLPDKSGDVSAYRTLANVSTIATIVGAAGAVTGITLLLTTPKSGAVTAYAGFVGAGLQGAF